MPLLDRTAKDRKWEIEDECSKGPQVRIKHAAAAVRTEPLSMARTLNQVNYPGAPAVREFDNVQTVSIHSTKKIYNLIPTA